MTSGQSPEVAMPASSRKTNRTSAWLAIAQPASASAGGTDQSGDQPMRTTLGFTARPQQMRGTHPRHDRRVGALHQGLRLQAWANPRDSSPSSGRPSWKFSPAITRDINPPKGRTGEAHIAGPAERTNIARHHSRHSTTNSGYRGGRMGTELSPNLGADHDASPR